MRLLLIFIFLALFCMVRAAPPASSTARVLILPDYHDDDQSLVDTDMDDNEEDNNIFNRDYTKRTTSKTTTIRSAFNFPSRNRFVTSTRQNEQKPRTSSVRMTPPDYFRDFGIDGDVFMDSDDDSDQKDMYNGDFEYLQRLRQYLRQLMERLKKMVRRLMDRNE